MLSGAIYLICIATIAVALAVTCPLAPKSSIFLEYREIVKVEIEAQLADYLVEEAKIKAQAPRVNVTALVS